MPKHKVYGWKPVEMYRNLTVEQLIELQNEIKNNPANGNPQHKNGTSIYLYTKSTRKKLDAIGWAIIYHLQNRKANS